jgi:sugar/nucleoside kinase (ribokinase family)
MMREEKLMAAAAILSHIVVDEIATSGCSELTIDVGGAGAYAAVGASLASAGGDTHLVAGVGRQDKAFLTDWCDARGIECSGLFVSSETSPRTRIRYFGNGERTEHPVYGLDHFEACTPLPRHIPAAILPVAGTYLFHAHEPPYWQEIRAYRATAAGPILWEISLDSCRYELLDTLSERLALVDVLSINRSEAELLLRTGSLKRLVASLAVLVPLVLLRLGSEGSMVIHDRRIHRVGVAPVRVVDHTGGGNSYSGAFLASFAVSGDPVAAARVAASAAGFVIAQHGAPRVTDELRASTLATARRIDVESLTAKELHD